MKTTIKKIRRPVILYLVALSLMLGVTSVALADTFTSIDFPGATFTQASGINPRGDIVGGYALAGVRHGFLLSGDSFTPIDISGVTFTWAVGVNPGGDIAGLYVSADGKANKWSGSGFANQAAAANPWKKNAPSSLSNREAVGA